MKRLTVFPLVVLLAMLTVGVVFAARIGADGKYLCPPPQWCPKGDVRYVPRTHSYSYTDGSAVAGGNTAKVTWDSVGPEITDVCVSTGRGMWHWDWLHCPPQHGWIADNKARICEVVLTTK